MKLYKRYINTVDGYSGDGDKYENGYITSVIELFDEDAPSIEDVREADEVYLSHYTYELIGDITSDEIKVLEKFKIL